MAEGSSAVPAGRDVLAVSPALRHCVINLNKPRGITSHQAVERVRRILGTRKAGHAGTLDPLATGVLLVCVDEATKISRFLSALDKEYAVVVKLGEKTDTYDAEGTVVEKTERYSVAQEDIERVLPRFTGTIEQIPPMYSAIKMGGKPLYRLARKGLTVEREKRTVTVHGIRITGLNLPFLEMRISCSKGTYIRSLCHDIGEVLGIGAHITELQRTRTGAFCIGDSLTPDDLEALVREQRRGAHPGITDIDEALRHFGELVVPADEFARARNGLPVRRPDYLLSGDQYVRLKDPSGKLFAVGKVVGPEVRIERMLHIE